MISRNYKKHVKEYRRSRLSRKRSKYNSCLKSKKVSYKRKGKLVTSCKTKRQSSPSRGWSKKFPRKGRERKLLRDQCGSKCFLEPSKLGFPICKAYRKRSISKCKPDCSGLISAYRRSRQWGHLSTAKKALSHAKRIGCSWV